MQSRSGRPPLTLKMLSESTHLPRKGGRLVDLSPGSLKVGYASSMNATFEEVFLQSFAGEMAKIAEATGDTNPFAVFGGDQAAMLAFFKEAGVMDALRGYGRNIAAWGRRGADVISGGGYARQMKELGSASPMSTSAAAGKVVGGQSGPMSDLAARRANAAASQASLNPAAWGLPSQAPARHVSPEAFGLTSQARRSIPAAGPGGAAPLFGAPGAMPSRRPVFAMLPTTLVRPCRSSRCTP